MWLQTSRACRNNPKYPAECADATTTAPLATPLRPPATFSTLACNGLDTGRNGFPFARNSATFARNRSAPARKLKTPKRRAESLGVRRSSTSSARVKRSPATETPSRPMLKASRATLRTLSLRGWEGCTRGFGGWAQGMKACTQGFGGRARGLEGLSAGVWELRVEQRGLVVASMGLGIQRSRGRDTPRYLFGEASSSFFSCFLAVGA
jgi:hypothetical protein